MAKGWRNHRLFLEVNLLHALHALYVCTLMGSWSNHKYSKDQ